VERSSSLFRTRSVRTFEAFVAFERFEAPWRLLLLRLFLLLQISMNRVIGTAEIDFVQEAFRASLFRKNLLQSAGDVREWKALFGCSPLICQTIWGSLLQQGLKPLKAQPIHLLRLLHFLKSYGTETVCSSFLNCDEKTFRNHMWPLLQAISDLRVVSQRLTRCRLNGLINQSFLLSRSASTIGL
jgi:hypothetical protein